MIEQHIKIETSEGLMETFITFPEEGGPFPTIFFFMDAPGKREELHDMARRIATTGYYVMLPNLYYRTTDHFELDFETKSSWEEMFQLMSSIGNRMVVQDALAMMNFAEAEKNADQERVGCVGYCMSGPFALSVAAAYPERIKASASIYGVRLVADTSDSPHLGFNKTRGEIYIACAEFDDYVPMEMVTQVTEELDNSSANGRVELYTGVHHGFAFPGRGEIYNKDAAERHWERLHALFDRNLR
ncbi:MAG: hydrolase [Acidimicrobiaceae bacterium]|nr:hydrolase [Acidimicrobiaceae bacterium]|tara:strand:+ start:3435 stop:4166 length:732 start_codon:yes stop_codon:yes gene_type:complete